MHTYIGSIIRKNTREHLRILENAWCLYIIRVVHACGNLLNMQEKPTLQEREQHLLLTRILNESCMVSSEEAVNELGHKAQTAALATGTWHVIV